MRCYSHHQTEIIFWEWGHLLLYSPLLGRFCHYSFVVIFFSNFLRKEYILLDGHSVIFCVCERVVRNTQLILKYAILCCWLPIVDGRRREKEEVLRAHRLLHTATFKLGLLTWYFYILSLNNKKNYISAAIV